MHINDNIRKARELKGFSQAKIAKLLDEKRSTYAEWERTTVPKADILQKISEITGVSMDEILSENSDFTRSTSSNLLQSPSDNKAIIIDHSLFLQLIAEKEARRLDAEEKAKQAREDLNEVKEEKKELMGIIKENLTALLISSNAARQDLAKILLVNRVDDGKIMDNQDIAAGREVGSSAKEAGMLELTTESAALLENRKQNEKGKRVRVRK